MKSFVEENMFYVKRCRIMVYNGYIIAWDEPSFFFFILEYKKSKTNKYIDSQVLLLYAMIYYPYYTILSYSIIIYFINIVIIAYGCD